LRSLFSLRGAAELVRVVGSGKMTSMSLRLRHTSSEPASLEPAEVYAFDGEYVTRTVVDRNGTHHKSQVPLVPEAADDPFTAFFQSWANQTSRPSPGVARALTSVDLFSGCGGLSLGLEQAAEAVGFRVETALAVDTDSASLEVFEKNFAPNEVVDHDIAGLVDGELGERVSLAERRLRNRFSGLDFLVGGPPCQGHSDLNNHTRRRDPKNLLYLRMARFAEVVRPRFVLVENVPGVVHDRAGVVDDASAALRANGYYVSTGVVHANRIGGAQTRRRHLLLASLEGPVDVTDLSNGFGRDPMTVDEALLGIPTCEGTELFHRSASHSAENRRRIDYLFDHDLLNLPDAERPDCHRLKKHSYTAVYGRMRGDAPAPTITRGFGSTGQGRFVHPRERRTLTPREAARIQGFPDYFDFSTCTKRVALHGMIGNAVPSRLAYAASMSLLLS
jgi:DNA (cytosine-5)-methyltransferase 1